jgi:hypothetical protein
MAPVGRYTAIVSTIWGTDSDFLDLSARAQWLYLRLWTSDDRDAAGFIPWQPGLWAKSSTTTAPETISAAGEELCANGWLLIDFDAERAWLCRFIAEDTFHSPNQYVAAMTRIRACPSWMLRDAAWKEIQRLGVPPIKSANEETRNKMHARVEAALDALRARMYANPEGFRSKEFRKSSERVSKLTDVDVDADADQHADVDAQKKLRCAARNCDRPARFDGYCDMCRGMP